MVFPWEHCPGKIFKTQRALRSHQTQKKCGIRETRSVSPSDRFLKWLKKRELRQFPDIPETKPEIVPRGVKKLINLKYDINDLLITSDVVPNDDNTQSAEYRTEIRAHFDAL